MSDPSRPPTVRRVLKVTLLATAPAIFGAGYLVWMVRDFLVGIHPLLYLLILLTAISGATQATAGNLLKDIREHARWRQEQREKLEKP